MLLLYHACISAKEVMKDRMKIYLLESGVWESGSKDLTKVFVDEQKAIKYCLHRFGIKRMCRKNTHEIKGFRCVWHTKKRWALLTEHKVLYCEEKL